MVKQSVDILLIDSDATRSDQSISRLRSSGFTVQLSTKGFQTLNLVENNTYKLAIIVEDLTDMSGQEILMHIRATHSKEEMPIISIHSTKNQEELIDFFTFGANDFLANSNDFGKLFKKISSFITPAKN